MTCALGPYNFEFMTAVQREIMARYGVDGIFVNRWAGSGMCYCEHCRDELPGRYRSDLPRAADPQDAVQRDVSNGAKRGSSRCGTSGTRIVRQVNPDARLIPNAAAAPRRLDMARSASSRRSCSPTARRAAA